MTRPARGKGPAPKPKEESSASEAAPWWQCDVIGNVQVEKVYGLEKCVRKAHTVPCSTATCLKGFPTITVKGYITSILGPDLRERRRDEGMEVGLKNLGNTCYMNSILQSLYHDCRFRDALFKWKGDNLVGAELQRLFARMQLGAQSFAEPRALVDALEVDPSVQQDADEFWNFLVTSLECMWKADKAVAGFLERHFQGQLMYETICSRCKCSSKRAEAFNGLTVSIKGHAQLEEALSATWAVEQLTGGNQYDCDRCGLQNAVRIAHVKKLPHVLVLKLMRFVYDPKKGVRQKVPQAIGYPHVLDLAPLCNGVSAQYDLTGVILHKGKTCYQGHYIAHVRESAAGPWYQADDDTVTLVKENEKAKGKKGEEGRSSSGEVYMLMYTRCDPVPATAPELPHALASMVQEENSSFLKDASAYQGQAQVLEQRATELRSVLQPLQEDTSTLTLADPMFFVEAQWLRAVMSGKFLDPDLQQVEIIPKTPSSTQPPPQSPTKSPAEDAMDVDEVTTSLNADSPGTSDNAVVVDDAEEGDVPITEEEDKAPVIITRYPSFQSLQCSHGKVNPCPPSAYRLIRDGAWTALKNAFGGEDLPTETMICKDCAQQQVDAMKEKERATNERAHALQLYRSSDSKKLEYDKTGYRINREWATAWGRTKPTKADQELLKTTDPLKEVSCTHGKLSPNVVAQRLVPDDVWTYISKEYHVTSPGFRFDAEPCDICQQDTVQQAIAWNELKNQKAAEKKAMRALYDCKPEDVTQYFRDHPREVLQSQMKKLKNVHQNEMAKWRTECKALKKKWAEENGPSAAAKAAKAGASADEPMDLDGEPSSPASPAVTSSQPTNGPVLPPEPVLQTFKADRFAVPVEWVSQWRQWVDSQQKSFDPRPGDCDTSALLCAPHQQFLYSDEEYRPAQARAQRRNRANLQVPFYLVEQSVWSQLVEKYNAGPEVKFKVQEDAIVPDPPCCESCAHQRREKEAEAQRQFVKESINYEATVPHRRRAVGKTLNGSVVCSHFDKVDEVRLIIYQQICDHVTNPRQIKLIANGTLMAEDDLPLSHYAVMPRTKLIVTVEATDDVEMPPANVRREGSEVGFARSALAGAAFSCAENGDNGKWTCSACTFINHVDLSACEICGTGRR